ncbi:MULTISPECIES: hypothetical protein [Paraburkholderia]|uniref:BspC domain-containing protein n=1 Tax=Paraburkholderia TaxID=1822464 RepID=UPI000477F841|nr:MULTISPECIES: hypothetical protein [Paraburkholderia]WEY39726.1 hypothetical protein P2869_04960 [Paraburkholderia sp. SUR17]
MDRTQAHRRWLRLVGPLAAFAASLSLVCVKPAWADQLEQHNELVNQFVNQMHADPLVADCAAHGNFVASTSTAFDHVEFPPSSFDSSHSSVTPWNDSFDEGKQRVKVDTIVTVEGLGVSQNGSNGPFQLKFRCGYVGQQMLAFSWNDPVPPAKPRANHSASKKGKGKHAATGNGSTRKNARKNSSGTKKKH